MTSSKRMEIGRMRDFISAFLADSRTTHLLFASAEGQERAVGFRGPEPVASVFVALAVNDGAFQHC